MDKIIVGISSLITIIFIAWFFFGKKEEKVEVKDKVDIKVSGGYEPSAIVIKKGKKTKINFLRTDPSDCLSEVILSDFKIRRELPLNKTVSIEIIPEKAGEFTFTCGMNMYNGKLIVKD